ncbi:hypothetical protein PEBR_02089 [Penicillium brasilianum]|uniref:Histone chaperone domain-containing protein n=1 Tax=Penicillium brasilianum TaxID=104259 RepID=A0A1S9RZP0_PENBI|nr:hypothetical protein PEBR_02089 [Penicillium brasilianum]
MSNPAEREAEDSYERENDPSPVPGFEPDDSWAREPNPDLQDIVPVQRDEQPVEDPIQPPDSNSDQQLAQDEREAVDQSNILRGERTRHAKPTVSNRYNEGPDEDDLPSPE